MKKGFTLMEALAVVGISGFTASLALNVLEENREKEQIEIISNDIADFIGGIDKRLANDRYDLIKWSQFNNSGVYIFNNREQVAEFAGKALIAKSAPGCGQIDGWNPDKSITTDESYKDKYRFIECGLWEHKMPFDLNAKAELLQDGTNVTGFNLDLFFESDEAFEEHFIAIKTVLASTREKDEPNKSGVHQYYFAKDSDGTVLSTKECIDEKTNCILRASFTGSDHAYEYLYTNGGNNMISSKVKFQDGVHADPNKNVPLSSCHRYVENGGNWTKISSVYCGLGIGLSDPTDPTSAPLDYVELAAESLTTNKIFLQEECDFQTSGGSTIKVPCGMYENTNNGVTEIIAVSEELRTTNAFLKTIEAKDINANFLKLAQNLDVDGNTTLKGTLNVDGASTFNNSVKIEHATGDALTVTGASTLDDVDMTGLLKVDGTAFIEGNVEVDGSLKVHGDLEAKSFSMTYQITESDLGDACVDGNNVTLPEGSIVKYKHGNFVDLAICADVNGSNRWKLVNTNKNEIIAVNGTCPSGFEKFSGAEGRTLIGAGDITDIDTGMTLSYGVGDVGGKSYHTLTPDEMPVHSHKFQDAYFSESNGTEGVNMPGSNAGRDNNNKLYTRETITDEVGGGQAHENRMPYYVVNWCVYKG